MPRNTTTSPETILANQAAAEQAFDRARKNFRQTSLKNSVALGQQITRIRESAGISRGHARKVLGVSYSSLYFVERPDKSRTLINPANQARYLAAVSTLADGVQSANAAVRFQRRRVGRPRLVTA